MGRVGQVDMSSRAIDRRLREVAQLYRLGLSISRARSLGRAGEVSAGSMSSPAVEKVEKVPDGVQRKGGS